MSDPFAACRISPRTWRRRWPGRCPARGSTIACRHACSTARCRRAAGRDRPAAVLILLFPRDGTPHVVLTVRGAGLPHHADQISLPGGRPAPGETRRGDRAARGGRRDRRRPRRGRPSPAGSRRSTSPSAASPSSRSSRIADTAPVFVPAPGEVAAVLRGVARARSPIRRHSASAAAPAAASRSTRPTSPSATTRCGARRRCCSASCSPSAAGSRLRPPEPRPSLRAERHHRIGRDARIAGRSDAAIPVATMMPAAAGDGGGIVRLDTGELAADEARQHHPQAQADEQTQRDQRQPLAKERARARGGERPPSATRMPISRVRCATAPASSP